MPTASDSTTTAASAGIRRIARHAWPRSVQNPVIWYHPFDGHAPARRKRRHVVEVQCVKILLPLPEPLGRERHVAMGRRRSPFERPVLGQLADDADGGRLGGVLERAAERERA